MNRKAFAHLFKMPVPMMEHFDHYLGRLRMAWAYCHISRQWMEWQAWEATLNACGQADNVRIRVSGAGFGAAAFLFCMPKN